MNEEVNNLDTYKETINQTYFKEKSYNDWFLSNLFYDIDNHGIIRIYSISSIQKIFLLFHNPKSCLLARILNIIIILSIVLSSANYIFSSLSILQYQPKTCSNPVCDNTNECPGYVVCKPRQFNWTYTVDLICVTIFAIDFGIRLLTVGFVPARLTGIVISDADELSIDLHDFNNDDDIVEYTTKIINDFVTKRKTSEKHNNNAYIKAQDLTVDPSTILSKAVNKTVKVTKKAYKRLSQSNAIQSDNAVNSFEPLGEVNITILDDNENGNIESNQSNETHYVHLRDIVNFDENISDLYANSLANNDNAIIRKNRRRFKFTNIWKYIKVTANSLFNIISSDKNNISDTDIDYQWNVKIILYMFTISSVIDLIAIIPFYVEYFTSQGQSLSYIRLLRLVRVIKFLNFNKILRNGVYALVETIRLSFEPLLLVSYYIAIGITFLGSLVYYFERGNFTVTSAYPHGVYMIGNNLGGLSISLYRSVPVSMYWAVVTTTTTGYGDITPQSIGGKIVAILTMYFGVILLALPVKVISNNFTKVYASLIGEDAEDIVYKAIVDLCEIIDKETDLMQSSNYTRDCHNEIINRVMTIVSCLSTNESESLMDKLNRQNDSKNINEIRDNSNSIDQTIDGLIKELTKITSTLE